MDISTPIPEAVEWSEGMLLSPQHMQQNDIYWSHQLRHLATSLQPYYWGLLDMVYDPDALADNHLLNISRLQAVMPDGLVIQYPGHYDAPLQLNLNLLDKWEGNLRIYLAVPVRAEGAASSQSRIQRYDRVAGALEVDECQLESRLEVARLRPKLSLLADARIPAKFTAFPLLDLVRDENDHIWVHAYHPPMLRLGSCRFLPTKWQLQLRLTELTKTMRSKIRDLVGGRKVDDNLAKLDNESRQQLSVARHLATMLPALEVQLLSGMAHPYDLYLKLAEMAGQLAAIGSNPSPPFVEAYQHENMLPGFETLLGYIDTRLKLINPQYETMLFDRLSGSHFSRVLPVDIPLDTLLIELRPEAGQDEEILQSWIGQARIASDDLMTILEQRRLRGGSIRQVDPRQLSGLNVAEGALLFEITNRAIELNGKRSTMIRQDRPLIIQGPVKGMPKDIILHRTLTRNKADPAVEQPVNA